MALTQRAAQLALAHTVPVAPFSRLRPGDSGDYRGVDNAHSANDDRCIAAGVSRVSKHHPTEFRP